MNIRLHKYTDWQICDFHVKALLDSSLKLITTITRASPSTKVAWSVQKTLSTADRCERPPRSKECDQ